MARAPTTLLKIDDGTRGPAFKGIESDNSVTANAIGNLIYSLSLLLLLPLLPQRTRVESYLRSNCKGGNGYSNSVGIYSPL